MHARRPALTVVVAVLLLSWLPLSATAAQEAPARLSHDTQREEADGATWQSELRPEVARLAQELARATGGAARLSPKGGTGFLRSFGTTRLRPVPSAMGLPAGASNVAAARAFLGRYGPLFGVAHPSAQLIDRSTTALPGGGSAVRLQQVHRGVPVFGGALVIAVDGKGGVLGANGEVSPDLSVPTTPSVSAAAASLAAVQATAKAHRTPVSAFTAGAPLLSVYDPALIGAGALPPVMAWRSEVTDRTGGVRQLVLIDAARGTVALQFNQVAESKSRYVCNRNNTVNPDKTCVAPYARVEGGAATGVPDVDLAYDYSGIAYDFFFNKFGRDSVDGHGMPLKSTVKYCADPELCPHPNAHWDGKQMTYGAGWVTDDMVAHELTHGVTQFTSGLLYYFESGAINESMSDVFGELNDLSNGRGNDAATVRWDLGEDLPGGAIRDMNDPGRFRDPDRVRSTNWYTGNKDNGGVHWNSGVSNKAASLMVDGGAFNGQTIGAIGIDKTARVYYQAQQLLTNASDYQDLFEVLQQACAILVGTNSITSSDCLNVRKAVTATEMNLAPVGGNTDAAMCDTAGQVRQDLFADDLENTASGRWKRSGAGWYYPAAVNPYDNYSAKWASSGVQNFWGDDVEGVHDGAIQQAFPQTIPSGRKTYLRFAHAHVFDGEDDEEGDLAYAYDGGRVEYSTDGGAHWVDAGGLPSINGYNASTVAAFDGPGYGGDSRGYRTSRFDLSSLAGKSALVRFRLTSDELVGAPGWFIDDVAVYSCAAPAPTVGISDARVVEGASGSSATAVFTVTRTSGTGAASVRYATVTDTAAAGKDFTAVPLTTLSFAAGVTSKTVAVPVLGDAVPEAHERFRVSLSSPSGLVLADSSGTGTITDDDAGTPASLRISDPVVTELDSSAAVSSFVVTRTGTTTEPVTFSWATAYGTATSRDLTAVPATTGTIPAGATSTTLRVSVTGDALDETNETFSVALSKVQGAELADSTGTATVVDEEGTITPGPTTFFRVADVRITEGAASSKATATLTVTRSGNTAAASVTVSQGSGTATVNRDVAPFTTTKLSFAAGETSKTVVLSVLGDAVPEAHETTAVRLSTASTGRISDDTGTLTITDTDTGTPTAFALDDRTVIEGGGASYAANFTLRRTGDTTEAVTVAWATATAISPLAPATAGKDYATRTPTTVTFAAGETTKSVTVTLLPDSTFERNEAFLLQLTSAAGATLADASAVATIADDD